MFECIIHCRYSLFSLFFIGYCNKHCVPGPLIFLPLLSKPCLLFIHFLTHILDRLCICYVCYIIQFCVQVIIVICWTKGYRFVGVLLLFFFSCSACPDSCINMMFDILTLYILVLIVVFCVPDSAMGTC